MPLDPNYRCLLGCSVNDPRHVNPMSTEDSQAFLRLSLMEHTLADKPGQEIRKAIDKMHTGLLEQAPGYRILDNRLAIAGVDVSVPLKAFTTLLCPGAGDCVLWAFTLALLYRDGRFHQVQFTQFAFAFPCGFPNEEQKSIAWRKQKIPADEWTALGKRLTQDNWLDVAESWPRKPAEVPNAR